MLSHAGLFFTISGGHIIPKSRMNGYVSLLLSHYREEKDLQIQVSWTKLQIAVSKKGDRRLIKRIIIH